MQTTTIKKLNRQTSPVRTAPERIIQFGTGVLLRGLIDYVLQQANNNGAFTGSVVQIKSTTNGRGDEFAAQDGLYTVAVRGVEGGQLVQHYELNAVLNRTLNANHQWEDVLGLAREPEFDIIISNTTEAGIVLEAEDKITDAPPPSFPAKLLALLYERYNSLGRENAPGFIIVPTELVSNNGDELRKIVLQLAQLNACGDDFINWLTSANRFCNSLVDRIVTGKPSPQKMTEHCEALGYEDELLIECEPYLLWAIEGDEGVQQKLSFALETNGVVVAPSIERFKELKLRLLNGVHSFICGKAFLKGFEFVKDAMADEQMRRTIGNLLLEEMAPTLSYDKQEVVRFAQSVLERFANPFIEHRWHAITLNYTQKMASRNIATLQRWYATNHQPPMRMTECFAWYLKFMQPVAQNGNEWMGEYKGRQYSINDPEAERFYRLHQQHKDAAFVKAVLQQTDLWCVDLTSFPGFEKQVAQFYLQP
jgi:tagaturonate reductase